MYKKIAIVLGFVFLFSCTPNYSKKLQDSLKEFESGKIKSKDQILKNFINMVSIKKLVLEKDEKIKFLNSILMIQDTKEKDFFLYTDELTKIDVDSISVVGSDENNKFTLIQGKEEIFLVNKENGKIKKFKITSDEVRLKKYFLMGDEIFYIKDKILFNFPKDSQIKDTKIDFPNKKTDNIYLQHSNSLTAIVTGSPGFYYISIFDFGSNKFLITKIKACSKKIYFNNNKIIYFSGNSGNWSLNQITFNDKIKRKLFILKNIMDIFFFKDGFFLQNSQGLFWMSYGSSAKKMKISLNYEFLKVAGNNILVKFKDNIFLISKKRFIREYQKISSIIDKKE